MALKYCYEREKLFSQKHSIYSFLFEKSDNLKVEKYKLTHVHEKDQIINSIMASEINDITIIGKGYLTFDTLNLMAEKKTLN